FVCTGNLCRSPMAEGLARSVLDREYPGMKGRFSFHSAGVAAYDGSKATTEAVEAMMERGIDISNHSAGRVTRSKVEESDLVLTMEEAQRAQVASLAAGADTPIFLLLKLGQAARKALATRSGFPERAEGLSGLLRAAVIEENEDPLAQKTPYYEVPDPIGMPVEEYRHVVEIMEGPIENILRVLTK
ncbi:MAG: hypothetical protein MUO75_05265, partial [Actinobacteria bacterium]|nr:hypothetical protein [Actinomycetota bacterium]